MADYEEDLSSNEGDEGMERPDDFARSDDFDARMTFVTPPTGGGRQKSHPKRRSTGGTPSRRRAKVHEQRKAQRDDDDDDLLERIARKENYENKGTPLLPT